MLPIELANLTLTVFPLKLKSGVLELVVFNFTVPSFRILAFIIARVPLVLVTPGLFPDIEIAKEACPLFICPLDPRGVRTVVVPNISPLLILLTSNKLVS